MKSSEELAGSKVRILDALGKVYFKGVMNQELGLAAQENWPTGVLWVEIVSENGVYRTSIVRTP